MSGGTALAFDVVVVTGASGLIGAAACRLLDGSGRTAVGLDRVPADDVPGHHLRCDVADPAAFGRALTDADRLGPVVGIVHCAGVNDAVEAWGPPDPTGPDDPGQGPRYVVGNVATTVTVAGVGGEFLVRRGRPAAIVLLASMYAHVTPDPQLYREARSGAWRDKSVWYVATKGATHALVGYYARRLAPHGVRVNGLSPGGVSAGHDDAFLAAYRRRVPLGRMAEASEVAEAILFLVSERSSYLVGQTVVLDGGYTLC